MLLAIDTSTRNAGVALAREGQVISSRSWRSAVNHTAELMPAVAHLLAGAGLSVNDLEGIAVALGPGGFSALRVGMSVAKGLALASGKPLVGIGTLDAEAQPYLQSGLPVCALLDAGRSEVSSGYFGADGARLREDRICPPTELIDELTGPILFCGEGGQPTPACSASAWEAMPYWRATLPPPDFGHWGNWGNSAWTREKRTTWQPCNPTTCECPPSAAPSAATG